jgi:hypothetical protein
MEPQKSASVRQATLPENIRLSWKGFARDKHSSLVSSSLMFAGEAWSPLYKGKLDSCFTLVGSSLIRNQVFHSRVDSWPYTLTVDQGPML